MDAIKIAIADDHKIFTEGLAEIFRQRSSEAAHDVVAIVRSGNQLLKVLAKKPVDVVFLALNMPDGDGLTTLPSIKQNYPGTKVIALTSYSHAKYIKAFFKDGGDGYLLKTCDSAELFDAMRNVMAGEGHVSKGLKVFPKGGSQNGQARYQDDFQLIHNLTKRETEILTMISRAKSNKEIANELFISDQTVSVHRKNIMRKLEVTNTVGLIKFALTHDLA